MMPMICAAGRSTRRSPNTWMRSNAARRQTAYANRPTGRRCAADPANASRVDRRREVQQQGVGITDGDTITVLRDGKPEKIRLAGIDCPESRQPFGSKAKQFAADLCFGKEVTIAWTKRDRNGRILGMVAVGEINFNHELLKAGLAWQFKKYDKSKELAELEAAARKSKVGLWSDPPPGGSVGLEAGCGGSEEGESKSAQQSQPRAARLMTAAVWWAVASSHCPADSTAPVLGWR